MLELKRVENDNTDFVQLVKMLDDDLNGRYGEDQSEYDQFNVLHQLDAVVVAYKDDIPAGCGAFKTFDAVTAEVKRMFVNPDFRGNGIAGKILVELEVWARELGYKRTILETGVKQQEAIGLYTKHGYIRIENYGQYRDMPASVCYAKNI